MRYLFDLDGTVYRGSTGIESAVTFIHGLQAAGNEPFYLTNNSSMTREQLQAKLLSIGIEAPLSHIYSSALATVKFVEANYGSASMRVVGADGIRGAFRDAGFAVVESGQADVLVMGIDRHTTYDKLADLSIVVQRGAVLIGTNEDVRFPSEDGFLPGNGSFVNLVANVSRVEPIFIGKPSPVMLDLIAADHGLSKDEMVMVGDNYDTDIMCGIRFGCRTIHVNTGVTPRAEVLTRAEQPTICVDSLAEFVGFE